MFFLILLSPLLLFLSYQTQKKKLKLRSQEPSTGGRVFARKAGSPGFEYRSDRKFFHSETFYIFFLFFSSYIFPFVFFIYVFITCNFLLYVSISALTSVLNCDLSPNQSHFTMAVIILPVFPPSLSIFFLHRRRRNLGRFGKRNCKVENYPSFRLNYRHTHNIASLLATGNGRSDVTEGDVTTCRGGGGGRLSSFSFH